MLLVKVTIGPSAVHGIGCFAAENIKYRRPIWKFVPRFDVELDIEAVDALPHVVKERFLNYAYKSKATGTYILCSDDARFFNHSTDPNVVNVLCYGEQEGIDIAARDIEEGEELLYDYRVFDEPHPHNETKELIG
jgi:SET domain-containing protein